MTQNTLNSHYESLSTDITDTESQLEHSMNLSMTDLV